MFQYRVFDLDSAGCLAGLPYELICGDVPSRRLGSFALLTARKFGKGAVWS